MKGDHAIVARGLVKYYYERRGVIRRVSRRIQALRGVSFRVEWGEVYGLLGPNGAGKTTTVKIISTIVLPDGGEAFVGGHSVVREPLKVRGIIGVMLSVERGFFWKLTGYENLKYFGLLYGLEGGKLDSRIDWALEATGLKELGGAEKPFEDMSLGMRARLGLARAMLKDPEVLILDEPTLGLDPPSSRHIRGLLRSLAREGKAILVTTHNMFEAEILCDRVGIISGGKIVAEGTPQELKSVVSDKSPIVLHVVGEQGEAEALLDEVRWDLGVEGHITAGNGRIAIRVLAEKGEEERVASELIQRSISRRLRVLETRIEKPSLEDVFIKVTQGGRM